MVFSKWFGRRRPARQSAGPALEDVDITSLGLTPRAADIKNRGGAGKPAVKRDGKVAGQRVEPGTSGRLEPVADAARPPAAIKMSDEEQARILAGGSAVSASEQEALLQELNKCGYNLKKMLDVVLQLQEVAQHGYGELSEGERQEALAFVRSLSPLVIKEEQPMKQVA